MANINMFPTSAGFLFPNGMFFPTNGKGHERLAYNILKDYCKRENFTDNPEFILQSEYEAILIRFRWGAKLVYLPHKAPKTLEGKYFFKKAVKFYSSEGFQVMNLWKISLENEFSTIESFIGEQYEKLRFFSKRTNYTNTVIKNSKGNYMYNPERIGD